MQLFFFSAWVSALSWCFSRNIVSRQGGWFAPRPGVRVVAEKLFVVAAVDCFGVLGFVLLIFCTRVPAYSNVSRTVGQIDQIDQIYQIDQIDQIDQIGHDLPLRDVVQDLYSTDPTQEICARSCRLYGSHAAT